MSYILDALKRAERERKQGRQVSVLDEIPAAPTAEPQPRVPRLLVPIASGVVALGALVFALVVWRHHGGPAAPPAPPVAAAPVAPPPAPPQPAPAPAQPPSATIEDGGKLATLDDVYQAPPPAAPGAPPADQAGPPPTGGASPVRRAPPPAPPADQQGPPPDAGAPAPGSDAPPADVPQEQAPPPPAADQAPPQQRQLTEMPENFRANFPAFTVDVHAYNSDPRRRFVLIGGKRYREGDTLTEGPRIIGIVAEGIVFEWQGQQVLYAISR